MAKPGKKPAPIDREAAEAIALQGLTFLAEDPARLLRFLKLTGLELGEVRARAGTPELSLAVLEHLAGDESLLLVFAAGRAVPAESVGRAIAVLDSVRS
jgi:Protein of unknown function (DUF3572)